MLGLARVQQKQGNLEKALALCEQALEQDNDHPRILEEIAKLQEQMGDEEAAQQTRARIKK